MKICFLHSHRLPAQPLVFVLPNFHSGITITSTFQNNTYWRKYWVWSEHMQPFIIIGCWLNVHIKLIEVYSKYSRFRLKCTFCGLPHGYWHPPDTKLLRQRCLQVRSKLLSPYYSLWFFPKSWPDPPWSTSGLAHQLLSNKDRAINIH